MEDSKNPVSRRAFVQGAIVLPALAGLLLAGTTAAQAKGTQAQFKYQAKPNDGHKCSQCTFFIAGSSSTANGTCKIVDGAISPNGWCTAFAAKKS
ncbi:MAG: high-potential iron-sulfur protein [Candidatus Baltobacteraceae bacterium]